MVAIALLHAFPFGPPIMAEQERVLTEAGYEVHVPDLLSPDRHYAAPDLSAMAHYVADTMEAAGHKRFAVAGLSLGGYVAMALLRAMPSRIEGLALIDTKATADSEAAAQARLTYAARVESEGMGWVPEATMDSLLGETTRVKRKAVVDQVRRWILAADPTMVAWAQRAMAVRPDSMTELQVFRQPAVVVVGQEDTLSPVPDALAMAQALGGAPMSEIAHSGHLSTVECPNRVAEVLVSWADRIHSD